MKTLTQLNESNFSEGYRSELLTRLQNAFREEINAWYGYTIMGKFLIGPCREELEKFFETSAKDEFEDHAMWILERINQLNGTPNECLAPETLKNVDHGYIIPQNLVSGPMSTEDAVNINIDNERGAIETYEALEKFTRDVDPVTNKKIKEIWADEEEHLSELNDFLGDIQNMKSNINITQQSLPNFSDFPEEF